MLGDFKSNFTTANGGKCKKFVGSLPWQEFAVSKSFARTDHENSRNCTDTSMLEVVSEKWVNIASS